MKILAKISAVIAAVSGTCSLWHILLPTSLGWMTGEQIFGTIGMLLLSSGITVTIFTYNQVNNDK